MLTPPACTARALGAASPLAKSWQLWHDCLPEADNDVGEDLGADQGGGALLRLRLGAAAAATGERQGEQGRGDGGEG